MNLSEWEGVDYFLWNIFFYVGVDFASRESFFELEEIYFSSGVATFFRQIFFLSFAAYPIFFSIFILFFKKHFYSAKAFWLSNLLQIAH